MDQIPKIEKKILKFWQKQDIFAKSIRAKKKSPYYSFYDGPPFASGLPHYGHVLASTIKDVVLRYWTMKGYQVAWRVGWDCHGLPVENQIEKELGLKSKKDIEEYGIEKFNAACRKAVFRCTSDWEKTLKRLARWSDYSKAYATSDSQYTESVWWVFKQLWDKGLVYQDFRVTPYCPRCGTPLSNFELNQPGAYQDIKDESVFIKFPIKGEGKTYFLVWTTTPWTLSANAAIAAGENIKYVEVKAGEEKYILAKERLSVLGKEYKIEREFLGKDLAGIEYEPLYKTEADKPAYRIVLADFVSVEDGTGLVHIAPAFGEDDMVLGQREKLPTIITVDQAGKVIEGLNLPGQGKFVKKADEDIKDDLEKRGLLFKSEKIVHAYPFCWRCESPLLYYPINSWYISVSKFKKQLVDNNKKIRWVPAHLEKGRFGKWLSGARDWSVSRNRFWGAPIPIWQCQECGGAEVIGGLKELRKKAKRNNYFILRHGQTKNNQIGVIYSGDETKAPPITGKGEKDVKNLIPELRKNKIDLIVSSDYLRACQTSSIVADALGVKVIYDKRLRDIDAGIFKGKKTDEYHKYFEGDDLKRFKSGPPQGENLNQVKKRLLAALASFDKKYGDKNILVVGHGDPLWLLRGMGEGLSDEKMVSKKNSLYLSPGQIASLNFGGLSFNKEGQLDIHRPFIDKLAIPCSCGGGMRRIKEVFDCWFESGSMPYAQWHYPYDNKKLVEKNFPADFIAEGIDQTRGWFYTLHVLASALTFGKSDLGKDQPAFKNVVVNGLILGEDGKKLSKRLKNYTPPEIIFNKYGADALRYFLLSSTPMGEDYIVSEKRIAETFRRIMLTLYNSFTFLKTYTKKECLAPSSVSPKNILDKWIVSRLNSLNKEVIFFMDQYELTKAARLFDEFLDDFSNWYIRRSRRRFQKPKNEKEKEEAEKIYSFVLLSFAKLIAPFMPFMAEEIYQSLEKGASVHLANYPKVNKKAIDKKLEERMGKIREIVALALAERTKAGIKVRQPLGELTVNNKIIADDKEMSGLIEEEVNIKKISFGKNIKLDTKITDQLKAEGIIRELIRLVQGMRKDGGLKPTENIYLRYLSDSYLQKLIGKHLLEIQREVAAEKIELAPKKKETFLVEKEVVLDGQKIWLGVRK